MFDVLPTDYGEKCHALSSDTVSESCAKIDIMNNFWHVARRNVQPSRIFRFSTLDSDNQLTTRRANGH